MANSTQEFESNTTKPMKKTGISHLIVPIITISHIIVINSILYILSPSTFSNFFAILYYNGMWLFITNGLDYYNTTRKEHFFTHINKMFKLYFVFGLAYFSLFAFQRNLQFDFEHQTFVYAVICLAIALHRWLFYWLRRKYRFKGGNYVKVVAIGRDRNLKKIRRVFDNPYLGYRYQGFFDDSPSVSPTYLGKIENCFGYILDNQIDEVYCLASKLSKNELQNLIEFVDNNLIKLKIIPDNKEIFTRAMSIQMYQTIPVLNLRTVPLDREYLQKVKRVFDIVFSSLVIIFVMSWLNPLIFILVKLDSPGPALFKQKRHGLKRQPFWCYKFRTMTVNSDSNTKMAKKNDARVTRLGKFLRKTSLDELPQFYNVFIGNMSVVGPRPHMEFHTIGYETAVDKYLVRHFVKPGITGLAQVMGYRGEIIKPSDIFNRTRLDIFYVEKWSIWLDLEIIFKTVYHVFKGEEKAY